MPTTMQLIAKQTVGAGGAASVNFTNIPQTFTDLKVVASYRGTTAQVYEVSYLRFNGVNANLTHRSLEGSGSSAGSINNPFIYFGAGNGATSTSNTFSNIEAYIPNYTSSNQKSVSLDSVGENNNTLAYMQLTAGIWADPAAITSIQIVATAAFVEFSEFTLYGISNSTTTQNPTTPSAIGGDVITTDGSFWYHAFKYSGSFTPLKNLTCDYLVVAGGGGGGSYGGGGGAGGLRSTVTASGGTPGTVESAISLTAQAYAITIGAGGTGTTTYGAVDGSNGGSSSIAGTGLTTITSVGGGKGAGGNQAGQNGGSGGGAGLYVQTGGSPTANQGYAGGLADQSGSGGYGGGGGGGAGQVGQNCIDSSTRGNGGNGVQITALATATSTGANSGYYAGGGGGGAENYGTGGLGGGANGITAASGNTGTANTGGGGGGAGQAYTGGQGGSGLVIVRYAV
jgi:hypothetical protein